MYENIPILVRVFLIPPLIEVFSEILFYIQTGGMDPKDTVDFPIGLM